MQQTRPSEIRAIAKIVNIERSWKDYDWLCHWWQIFNLVDALLMLASVTVESKVKTFLAAIFRLRAFPHVCNVRNFSWDINPIILQCVAPTMDIDIQGIRQVMKWLLNRAMPLSVGDQLLGDVAILGYLTLHTTIRVEMHPLKCVCSLVATVLLDVVREFGFSWNSWDKEVVSVQHK